MTTVIGLDPSISSTGMVTWRDGRFYVATIKTKAHDPMSYRHHLIVSRVLAMRDPAGPTLVTMEGRITPHPDAVQTAMDLAELRGVINHGVWVTPGMTKVDVHPSTLKVYGAGRGDASKQDMLLAAKGRLGQHIHVANDDEADGAWLAAITLDRYGRPMCGMPVKNRAAVDRIDWPPTFTLEGQCTSV